MVLRCLVVEDFELFWLVVSVSSCLLQDPFNSQPAQQSAEYITWLCRNRKAAGRWKRLQSWGGDRATESGSSYRRSSKCFAPHSLAHGECAPMFCGRLVIGRLHHGPASRCMRLGSTKSLGDAWACLYGADK